MGLQKQLTFSYSQPLMHSSEASTELLGLLFEKYMKCREVSVQDLANLLDLP